MIKCRKCKQLLSNQRFRYLKIEGLSQYKRETCKDCWRGLPFSRAILKRYDLKAKARGFELFDKQRKEGNFRSSKRRADKLKATPSWANLLLIKQIYSACVNLTIETGIEHHVDHIVPLNNGLVCGLHVHYNLQIITASENLKKSNKHNV